MKNWEKQGTDKLYLLDEGVKFVKPQNYESNTPVFCPVCKFSMRLVEDVSSFEEFKCCSMCSTIWARKYEEKWKTGWRPPEEDVLNEMLVRRPDIPFKW